MIGDRRPFMTIRSGRKATLTAVALAAASVALAGCMGDPFNARVEKSSPAAANVKSVMGRDMPYPKWSQFPAEPKGVPTQADFASRAQDLQQSQADTLASARSIDWTLSGTEQWAQEARNQINPTLAASAPPNAAADTQAFVDAARKAATPPPPPK